MTERLSHIGAVLMAGILLGLPAVGWAQTSDQMPSVFEDVGVDEQLGTTIPMDLVFRNEAGEEVALGTYFDGETPVVLAMVYHNCPMLCNLLLDGFTKTLAEMAWTPGQEFEVVTVSFSADETPELAARQKKKYVGQLGRPAAATGWHFLTGEKASIMALADAVGFQFKWVAAQQEYAHPAALMFVSGSGKLTRYLYGLEYVPRDVRNALVEASEGKVGDPIDQILLYCFQYDPQANSYVPHAINIMKAGGLLTMLALGSVLLVFWRRERRKQREEAADEPAAVS